MSTYLDFLSCEILMKDDRNMSEFSVQVTKRKTAARSRCWFEIQAVTVWSPAGNGPAQEVTNLNLNLGDKNVTQEQAECGNKCVLFQRLQRACLQSWYHSEKLITFTPRWADADVLSAPNFQFTSEHFHAVHSPSSSCGDDMSFHSDAPSGTADSCV